MQKKCGFAEYRTEFLNLQIYMEDGEAVCSSVFATIAALNLPLQVHTTHANLYSSLLFRQTPPTTTDASVLSCVCGRQQRSPPLP